MVVLSFEKWFIKNFLLLRSIFGYLNSFTLSHIHEILEFKWIRWGYWWHISSENDRM